MRLSRNRAEFFGLRMAAHGITQVPDYIDEMPVYDWISRVISKGAITPQPRLP
jgi:hypothetical protein